MSGRVPPSSRAGKRVQSTSRSADVRKAASLYQRFSGHKAEEIAEIDLPAVPPVGVAIGDIDGILYTTIRDGVTEHYKHEFAKSDRPLFVVSPDGKQLFIVGGRYRFTERGIVDNSDKSR